MRKFIFLFVFFFSVCFLSAQEVDQGVGVRVYFPLVMNYTSNAFILSGADGTGLTAGQYFNFNNVSVSDRVYPTSNYTGTYIPTSDQQNISYRIYSRYYFQEFTDISHIYVCHTSNPAYQNEKIDINSGASVVKNLGFSANFLQISSSSDGGITITKPVVPQSTKFRINYEIFLHSFDGPYKKFSEGSSEIDNESLYLSNLHTIFSHSFTESQLYVNSEAVERISVRLSFTPLSGDSFTFSDSQNFIAYFLEFYRFLVIYGPYFSRCPHTPSCVITYVDLPSDFKYETYQGKRVYFCQTHVVFYENPGGGDPDNPDDPDDPDNPDNPDDPDNPDNPDDPDDPDNPDSGSGDYSSALDSINNSLSQSNTISERILSQLHMDGVEKGSWDNDDWREIGDRYIEQFTSDIIKKESVSSFSDSLFGFTDMMNAIRQLLEFDYSYFQPTTLSLPILNGSSEFTLLPWPAPPDSVYAVFRRYFKPLCVCVLYVFYTIYFCKAAYWVLSVLFSIKATKTE